MMKVKKITIALLAGLAMTSPVIQAATLTFQPNVATIYPGQAYFITVTTDAALDPFGGCHFGIKGLASDLWTDSTYQPNGDCYKREYKICTNVEKYQAGDRMVFEGWIREESGNLISQKLIMNVIERPSHVTTPDCQTMRQASKPPKLATGN